MTSRLSKKERELLGQNIQYLNLEEMRTFCRTHDLPLYIHVEQSDGRLRRSGDRDRKDVVLERILDFALNGKKAGPTVYALSVVGDQPLPRRLTARTRIHYGQYEKKNEHFVEILKKLTGGSFRTGMIARLVLRDFWTAGQAPTFQEFADEWLRSSAAHTEPRPEGAYLVDRWRGKAQDDWKAFRIQRAGAALRVLDTLSSE